MNLRTLALALALTIGSTALLSACAGQRTESSLEREVEEFYSAFETEVRGAVRDLAPEEQEELIDVMPTAEFEGATEDVLAVIATRSSLVPMVRRIERFLSTQPSNRVDLEIEAAQGDRRLWHILLNSINDELGRPSEQQSSS